MTQEVLASTRRGYRLIVLGVPAPQGSLKPIPHPRIPGRSILVHDNPKSLAAWRRELVHSARNAHAEVADRPFEAIQLDLQFYFLRPQGHYGARGNLLSSAPRMKTTGPDLDKLVRAVYDALKQAGVVRDDAHVVKECAGKHFADPGKALESGGLLLVVKELV